MKSEGKEKFGKNKWLVSDEFMSKIDFFDKYYIKELGKKLKRYLEHVPIHVITTWDSKNKRIYFKIGRDNLYYVPVDVNVSFNDYLSLVYDKIKKHYPQYNINYSVEEDYTEDDVRQIMKETGKKLSDIVWEKKSVIVTEQGVITKVNIPDDLFTLTVQKNDMEEKELRKCTYKKTGIDENKVLDTFLKDLRNIITYDSDQDIANFIYDNSEFIEEKSMYKPPVKVDYEGEMLLNFFKINRKWINEKAVCMDVNLYRWGNYEIFFQNDMLKKNCLKLIEVENLMYS